MNEAILNHPTLLSIFELKGNIHLSWGESESELQYYEQALTLITDEWESLRSTLLQGISALTEQLST